ncbi:MAG: hypothetical protein FWD58_10955 [Firmicutes bacterium]|nr:hypothetical protein [Bacillota bacterium]
METEKVKKEKPVKVSNFIIVETFAGKKDLRDIVIDFLCSAYGKETAKKPSVKP